MFSESEKIWIDKHSGLIESKACNDIWKEAEKVDKNFASRLLIGVLYLNTPEKFIIKLQPSLNDSSFRVYLYHPSYNYLNFIFTRISLPEVSDLNYDLPKLVKSRLIELLVEGGIPGSLAEDLIVNKSEIKLIN